MAKADAILVSTLTEVAWNWHCLLALAFTLPGLSRKRMRKRSAREGGLLALVFAFSRAFLAFASASAFPFSSRV